ncbi:MAG: SDR family oxidoreductase [Alcaligenaceae bacterium]|nr:SDR family oxidoreductase [Alcaligenaceae bacterium]
MSQVKPDSTGQGSMHGRVAIVAGACGGIGRVVAQDLVRRGAQLALWDTDTQGLEALRAQIPSAAIISADLTDEAAVEQAMEQTIAQCGRVDILVHCVGVTGPCLPVSDYPPADWQRTLDINLKSAFLCSRVAVAPMRAAGYGRIVFLASIAGKEGNADMSAYSAAKAGVIALTKSLGKELAKASILVNCVAPAVIETPLNRQMTPEALQASLSRIPLGRAGQPQEVANLIGWLASEECSFSTGACFDLSGGRATY